MATIQEVEQSLIQAREQLKQERQKVSEQRQQLSSAERQRIEAREKLPKPTARLLRSGMFSGLEGRKRRQQVQKIKKGIGSDLGQIGMFKEELTKREKQELAPFESQIIQEEKKLAEAKAEQQRITEYNSAAKVINKLIARGDWHIVGMIARFESGVSKQLAEKALKQQQALTALQARELEKVKVEQKGITPIYDKFGRLQGFDDPFQQVTRLATPAEKIMFSSGFSSQLTIPQLTFQTPRDLGRTELIKDFSPMGNLNIETKKVDTLFRTTGSPIRMTKLTSPVSRGYIADRKQTKTDMFKPKIKSDRTQRILPDRKIFSNGVTKQIKKPMLFLEKKSKKEKKERKKKTLWGF